MSRFLNFLISETVELHKATVSEIEFTNIDRLKAIEKETEYEYVKKVIRNLPEEEQKFVTDKSLEKIRAGH